MLVLTRRRGERVLIGEDIHVTVVEVWGNQVRLGIHAPKDVRIVRDDLLQKLHENGESLRRERLDKPAAAKAASPELEPLS